MKKTVWSVLLFGFALVPVGITKALAAMTSPGYLKILQSDEPLAMLITGLGLILLAGLLRRKLLRRIGPR